MREYNQLHSDLIEAKEAHQQQVKDLKRQIHKLECECNNLQLTSSRNIQKIKELETESATKSKKILELQGKCLKPTVINVGLGKFFCYFAANVDKAIWHYYRSLSYLCLYKIFTAKKRPCFPLRRPVLEAEPMPKARSSSSLPKLSSVEPRIINIISMADHKIHSLSQEVTKLQGDLLLQTDTIETLEKQVY